MSSRTCDGVQFSGPTLDLVEGPCGTAEFRVSLTLRPTGATYHVPFSPTSQATNSMSNVPEHADTARGPHFELWHLGSGSVIHTYPTEATALAFVRDVLVVAGHDAASKFRLTFSDARGRTTTIAEGTDLVRRVLEDRVL